jgi:hypothetical protein
VLLNLLGIFLNKTVLIIIALAAATGILATFRYGGPAHQSQAHGSNKTEVKKMSNVEAKKMFNVKDFGAKGDGVADDYEALQAAAWAVCQSPGATLLFPEGVYQINRYRIVAGVKANNNQNIRYTGCKGTTITGVRAKIEAKGDFRRRADKKEGSYSISYSDSITPFEMINSSGFHIIGFELDGNVNRMSRDAKVAEGSASGIITTNCQDYFIDDVTVHGFAADGLTLGVNSDSPDQRAHLVNVTSTHNARRGLAIVQVQGAEVINSVFNENGRTGVYGSHAPAAGVAFAPAVQSSSQEKASTGNITFDRCRFEENLGPQFLSERPDLVDSLSVKNSHITSTLPDAAATTFMSVAKVGLVQGNTFNIAAGHGVALAGYSPTLYGSISRLIYCKNTFNLGDNKGLIAPLQPAPVEMVENNIRVESRKKDPTVLRLDYLKLVENNFIFEANSGYSDVHYTILYEKGNATIRNNKYDTDRTGPGYFDVYYGPNVVASGEIFQHPANFGPHYYYSKR